MEDSAAFSSTSSLNIVKELNKKMKTTTFYCEKKVKRFKNAS